MSEKKELHEFRVGVHIARPLSGDKGVRELIEEPGLLLGSEPDFFTSCCGPIGNLPCVTIRTVAKERRESKKSFPVAIILPVEVLAKVAEVLSRAHPPEENPPPGTRMEVATVRSPVGDGESGSTH